ncbi:MAG: hypothetical protein M1490_02040 [Candidatus Bathyarchaeota archaeon]|nr:hypothetical protein [Candidatus Bathyarchaeota archaeon]
MNLSTYDITVTPQNSGTISMTLTPQSVGTATFNGLDFALKFYYNNNIVTSGSWVWSMNNNNEPITITVDSNQNLPFSTPTPTAPELTPIAIVGALVVITLTATLWVRKAKNL